VSDPGTTGRHQPTAGSTCCCTEAALTSLAQVSVPVGDRIASADRSFGEIVGYPVVPAPQGGLRNRYGRMTWTACKLALKTLSLRVL
jgi:hypothetical protein